MGLDNGVSDGEEMTLYSVDDSNVVEYSVITV